MVYMMHNFFTSKWTPYILSNNEPMFCNVSIPACHRNKFLRAAHKFYAAIVPFGSLVGNTATPHMMAGATPSSSLSRFAAGRIVVKLLLALPFHVLRLLFVKTFLRAIVTGATFFTFPCFGLIKVLAAKLAVCIECGFLSLVFAECGRPTLLRTIDIPFSIRAPTLSVYNMRHTHNIKCLFAFGTHLGCFCTLGCH